MRTIVLYSSAALMLSNGAVACTKVVSGDEVRDSLAVGINKDDCISPEKMRQHLQDQWARKQVE